MTRSASCAALCVAALCALCALLDFALLRGDVDAEGDPWLRLDKWEHAGVCFAIQVGASEVLERKGCKQPAVIAAAATVAIGAAKEAWDGPRASLRDMAADLAGILAAIAAKGMVGRRRKTKREDASCKV